MAHQPHFPDWYKLSHEMSWRAATYSSQARVVVPPASREGFFRFKDLESLSLSDIRDTDAGMWWWIYSPLLVNLLKNGSQSKALWIALGHHLGRPGDTNRQWCYFLPSDWETPENRTALYRLVVFFSYNASFPTRSSEHLLLTTNLLEQLSDKSKAERGQSPLLFPLVITSSGSDDQTFQWPKDKDSGLAWKAMDSDWRELREYVRGTSAKSLIGSSSVNPLIKRLEKNLRLEASGKNPAVHFCNSDELGGEAFVDNYERRLDKRREALCRRIAARHETTGVRKLLFGDADCPTQLAYWTSGIREEDMETMIRKSLNYLIWLSDVAPPERWSHIISVPSWLPATKTGGRSGSIVVCVRNKSWLEGKRNDVLVKEVTNFISTFRLGSLNIAAEAGQEREKDETNAFIAHEVPKNLNTIEGAIEGNPAFGKNEALIAVWYLRNLHYLFSAEDQSLRSTVLPSNVRPITDEADPSNSDSLVEAYRYAFQSQAAVGFERATDTLGPSVALLREQGWQHHYRLMNITERRNGTALYQFVQRFEFEDRKTVLLLLLFLLSESFQGCFKALLTNVSPSHGREWIQINSIDDSLSISNIGIPPSATRARGIGTEVLARLKRSLAEVVKISGPKFEPFDKAQEHDGGIWILKLNRVAEAAE